MCVVNSFAKTDLFAASVSVERAGNLPEQEQISTPESFDESKHEAMQKKVKAALSDPQALPCAYVERIYHDSIQTKPLCTNVLLKAMYRRGTGLGGGGEGAVVKVTDRKTEQIRALKISNNCHLLYESEVLAVIDFILDREISPHLTKVYQMMKIPCARNPVIFKETGVDPWVEPTEDADFVNDPKGEEPLMRYGFEMELLDGDISRISPTLTPMEKCAIEVQAASIHHILNNSFDTYVSDDKYRNIFYKQLDETVTFKGKKLINYDFWKYTFDGTEFYIPRMKYLIKLGDYDGWSCNLFRDISSPLFRDRGSPQTKGQSLNTLSERLNKLIHRVDVAAVAEMFKKPSDPNAKILDMENQAHF